MFGRPEAIIRWGLKVEKYHSPPVFDPTKLTHRGRGEVPNWTHKGKVLSFWKDRSN